MGGCASAFNRGIQPGEGEARDQLGRLYTCFTGEELTGLLSDADLTVTKCTFGTTKGLDDPLADWICIT